MTRVDWSEVKKDVKKAFKYFDSQDVTPSLRTLFYRLESKGILPHTDSYYKSLSKKLVKWRKEGVFSWTCIKDENRVTHGETADFENLNDTKNKNFEDRIERKVEKMDAEKLVDAYLDFTEPHFSVQRWANQDEIVEVWVEKEALADTMKAWLKDLDVKIRINKGYSSWTFLYHNVKELKKVSEKHEKVTILYVGDHDPSGLDMDRFLKRDVFPHFGVNPGNIEIVREALTFEQTEKYGLPAEDVNTRDPRADDYIEKYGNNAWEVDSLVAYNPEDFKKDIRETVKNIHDSEKYEQLRKKKRKLQKKARKILNDTKKKAENKVSVA